jgi:hypothetical protein
MGINNSVHHHETISHAWVILLTTDRKFDKDPNYDALKKLVQKVHIIMDDLAGTVIFCNSNGDDHKLAFELLRRLCPNVPKPSFTLSEFGIDYVKFNEETWRTVND